MSKVGEPLSAGEARKQLFHVHVALGKIIRSEAEFREQEFDEAGDSFADIANHAVPQLRLIVRLLAPLILIGALVGIWAKLLGETPWWQNLRQKQAQDRAARAAAQVVDIHTEPYVAAEQAADFNQPTGSVVTPQSPPNLRRMRQGLG